MTHAIDLDAVLARIGRQIETGAAERDAEDAFAADGYRLLRDHRVFSALVPAELGGGGTSHGAMCRFIRGLGRRCPSTALALSMHQHLVAAALANHLAGRPGRTLLEAVAGGERILVSTGANDWLDSNGRAEPVEGGWRVTAVKPFASGAPMGNMLVTSAVATPAGRGEDGGGEVLHMAMPLSAAGVTVGDDWQALGMRATGSHTVSLEGVFVAGGRGQPAPAAGCLPPGFRGHPDGRDAADPVRLSGRRRPGPGDRPRPRLPTPPTTRWHRSFWPRWRRRTPPPSWPGRR